jgi:hypothetical protein
LIWLLASHFGIRQPGSRRTIALVSFGFKSGFAQLDSGIDRRIITAKAVIAEALNVQAAL